MRADLLDVLYEDNHLLVVHKPAGTLSQGDPTGDPSVVELARAYLARKYHKPGRVFVGLLHRLDRPVSGVLVLARTSKAARRITDQIKGRGFGKSYVAVVSGSMPDEPGRLVGYIVKRGQRHRVLVLDRPAPGAREAVLDYRVLARERGFSLLEIDLLTGRSHQIRAQLAATGHPILGDWRYGSRYAPLEGRRIALHAAKVTFLHPITRTRMTIEAPLPDSWPWPPPEELRVQPRRAGTSTRSRPAASREREGAETTPGRQPPSPPEIVYRDDDLVVVCKPPGLPTQATLDPTRPSLESWLAEQAEGGGWLPDGHKLVVLTRLPADSSGLVLVSASRRGSRELQARLQTRAITRTFLLVVEPGRGAHLASMEGIEARLLSRRPTRWLLEVTLGPVSVKALDRYLERCRVSVLQGPGWRYRHLGRITMTWGPKASETTFDCQVPRTFDTWSSTRRR